MKEKPILFSGPMVRALLENRKTQTRRVIKTTNPSETVIDTVEKGGGWWDARVADGSFRIIKPAYQVGDRLWVRETHAIISTDTGSVSLAFKERHPSGKTLAQTDGGLDVVYVDAAIQQWAEVHKDSERWRPSIFMPRWASRLTLEVTGVRAERLQGISETDAVAEGCDSWSMTAEEIADIQISDDPPDSKELARLLGPGTMPATAEFHMLWDSINGKRPGCAVKDNPWVWVYEFKRVAK